VISRQITCKPENDDYRRLAIYIAAAGKQDEKCLMAWCAGCCAGDDYELGVIEVRATQDLNTRSAKEKTYHLLVSFRPEDEAKLTPEVLKEIEQELAKALGFEEHQRHCGVHKNTNNLHMHIAYNMIHPEKLTRREPYRAYLIRDRLCRELEQRFSLSVDNGRLEARERGSQPLSDAAATVEAHSGQQSFEGYCSERKDAIMTAQENARTWSDLHRALAEHGLFIKPHGNGMAIVSSQGRYAIKASRLDRSMGKLSLEKRFGPYQEPYKNVETIQVAASYDAKPLHRDPERDNLFAEYQAGITKRKSGLANFKEQRDSAGDHLSREWEHKRREIEAMPLTKKDRAQLLRQARQFEAEARKKLAKKMTKRREDICEEVPFTSWAGFLRTKATHGNAVALAVLRSRNEVVEAEQDEHSNPKPIEQRQAIRQHWFERQQKIQGASAIRPTQKKELAAIARMHQLAAMEISSGSTSVFKDFSYRIDGKGTVLFSLASGGLIRDTGEQVFFSAHDKVAQDATIKYAQAKWGKNIYLDGNRVRQNRMQFLNRSEKEDTQGDSMER